MCVQVINKIDPAGRRDKGWKQGIGDVRMDGEFANLSKPPRAILGDFKHNI
jgi:hypothetical protein